MTLMHSRLTWLLNEELADSKKDCPQDQPERHVNLESELKHILFRKEQGTKETHS